MKAVLIKNASIVDSGELFYADILIKNQRIEKIAPRIEAPSYAYTEINAEGLHLFPGMIDDQVHFREPGLTHKGSIYTGARAAVAGGVTSFMDMPNTKPQTITQQDLEDKFHLGSQCAVANYSFYMGATNDNLNEILKTDPKNVCGIKIFLGASTGNMLVNNEQQLENIFSQSPMLKAVHCEYEPLIQENSQKYKNQYGNDVPMHLHPLIRSEEACWLSSSHAVELAKKHDSRLHILHISTAKELELFDAGAPDSKRITAEACVHHLWFNNTDYERLGSKIKWNPAIKTPEDQKAILQAILDDKIDVIATDHAPHTLAEKSNTYWNCPSGGPLVQHSLVAMLEFYKQGKISLEKIVEKMANAPARLFHIKERGFIREGYYADLCLVNLNDPWTVDSSNILYRCAWSPFEGQTFSSKVITTFVNGNMVFDKGVFNEDKKGLALEFEA